VAGRPASEQRGDGRRGDGRRHAGEAAHGAGAGGGAGCGASDDAVAEEVNAGRAAALCSGEKEERNNGEEGTRRF
jgi:hypothetical protein